jgi:uncharacterized DUF497 family protein
MRIDWHEAKRDANLAKHGIDFADIAPVFASRMLVSVDTRQDYGETRYVGIGMVNGREVTVVWAEHRNVRWIISARRAHAKERQQYHAAP